MTNKQRDAFINKFSAFMTREGISGFSGTDEGSFSWWRCDCCKTELGGDRYSVTGYIAGTGAVAEYDVCRDCMFFEANGQLPGD